MVSQTDALRRTSIAACFVLGDDLHVFFQDLEGEIRHVWYDYAKGYQGGTKASIVSVARDTKYNGPIAVVSSRYSDYQITLFFIGKFYYLRGIEFDGAIWRPLKSLNRQRIRVHPSSSLAALRSDLDQKLWLYCQDINGNARELLYESGQWAYTSLCLPALVGSSLACEKWLNDDSTLREIQFFYQDPTTEIRSHFYLEADRQWNYGYLHIPNQPPQTGIAVAAHRHLGYNADVARVYVVEPSRIVEHAFYSDTEQWATTELTQSLAESKAAATWFPLDGNPEVRLFYLGLEGELKGYSFQHRSWTNEHDLPCSDAVSRKLLSKL